MTPIEQQALALVNEVRVERGLLPVRWESLIRPAASWEEAICRAIERHEAFRREVSDAVETAKRIYGDQPTLDRLKDFIIPKPVDPLVEAFDEAMREGPQTSTMVDQLRKALAARGLEIVEKKP